MGKCVVKKCESMSQKQNKANGITFHVIPQDPVRRKKWVKIIRRLRKETDWLPTKRSIICSKHFRNEDKIGSKSDAGRVYLSDKAVPMIFNESNVEEQMENSLVEISHEDEKVETDDDEMVKTDENMDTDEDEKITTDEEIDEITESLKLHKMRKKMNHFKFTSTKRHLKIKSLAQKNRRLERNNMKLKLVIEELKKQLYKKLTS